MSLEINSELQPAIDLIRQAEDKKHFIAQNGQEYVVDRDGSVCLLTNPTVQKPLTLNQLSGLTDWLVNEGTKIQTTVKDFLMIQVVSPTEVRVIGALNSQRRRSTYVNVNAVVDDIPFGRFLDQEDMVILLQSQFVHDEEQQTEKGIDDRDILLQVVSNLRSDEVQQQTDDGVSQTVQINSGVASVSTVKVPNPVTLIPYRTFQEIEQPASKFIFRMHEGMTSALFEADNSQWKVEAKQRIKAFLNEEQQKAFGEIKFPVIA
ncbi:hypothetical protein HMPREF9102_0400 [Limosilactobacillus oris F0423]|uniref:Phage protein n=1 Tax=Limosilactobacillus oris F0423 TaxID=944562 RepID=A0ABN0D673_9LACO|nr:hypothetical protein [Limosilactobacillus oris]EGS38009.1 hypothetical protein HMPREF9102_0400 [Limosilactobacillus oris F0423]